MGTRARQTWAVLVPLFASAAIAGCSNDSAAPAPTTLAPTAIAAGATTPPVTDDGVTETLALGELAVSTTPSGFSASAEDAERCGSSEWHLTGAVDYVQASPVPDQCFGGAHAFDTSWYGLSLPPGDYEISLTVRRGTAAGTTSTPFTITGA